MDVALFITCLTDNFAPRVGVAMVKALEHFGCPVAFPAAQTCCGQPMFNNGLRDDARALARRMIRVFEPFEYVVTPSGSCAAMIREHYRDLFDSDRDRSAAAQLAAKTYEFVDFLNGVLKIDWASRAPCVDAHVTYHYSCHLRGIGQTDATERVLTALPGLTYTPLATREQCCGFGGAFALKFASVSAALARDKVADIAATGADTLICNEAGCGMHIAGACRRAGVNVRVCSLAELLADALHDRTRSGPRPARPNTAGSGPRIAQPNTAGSGPRLAQPNTAGNGPRPARPNT
ncbi:MAG: (Fe-S)-binding protein, partial [Planctomycetota bacterium]